MSLNRVAVISAGQSGTGADAAWQLSTEGYDVAVLCSSRDEVTVDRECSAICVSDSRRSANDVQQLVDRTMDRWGRVDALVNSADFQPSARRQGREGNDLHAIMDQYLMNIVRPTRLIAPVIAAHDGGTILNVLTFGAFDLEKLGPAMEIFRSAMENFCELIENRYADRNVTMMNVVPKIIVDRSGTDECATGMPIRPYRTVEELPTLISYLLADTRHLTEGDFPFDGRLPDPIDATT